MVDDKTYPFQWFKNVRWETWDSRPKEDCCGIAAIGEDAAMKLMTGSLCVFIGPGVGSAICQADGVVIIALPNNRLFKADLKAEIAEFMDYSDDAAMVAPEFRQKLN
jgi:hypothetical protein